MPLLLLYLATARYTEFTQSNDAEAVAVAGTTLAATGSLTMDAFTDNDLWLFWNGERYVTNRFPGAIFLTAAFAWVLGAEAGAFWVGGVAAAVTTAAAMGFLAVALTRLADARTAAAAALVFGVTTSTWGISSASMWTHGPNQLWLALAMISAAAAQHLRSGLWFGAALLTRPQLGVVSAVHGLITSVVQRSARPALAIAAGTAIGLAALLTYNASVLVTGETGPEPVAEAHGMAGADGDARPPTTRREPTLIEGGYGSGPLRSLVNLPLRRWAERVVGALVSPNRGVFVQSPWLIVICVGLYPVRRSIPRWAASLGIAGLIYFLVQMRLNVFTGGVYFVVYRLPIETLTLAAPAALVVYQEWVRHRVRRLRAFWTLAAMSAGIQFFAAATRVVPDFADAAQRQEEWTWLEYTQTVREQPLVMTAVVAAFTGAAAVLAWLRAPRGLAAQQDLRPSEVGPGA